MFYIIRSGLSRSVLATFSWQKYFRGDFVTGARVGEILGRGEKGKKTGTPVVVESSLHGTVVRVLSTVFPSQSACVEEDEVIFSKAF